MTKAHWDQDLWAEDLTAGVPSAASPVRQIPPDKGKRGPQVGVALCLSGGGYRAMLFHLGTLIRLNEAGALPKIARVSSVSGGSIVAAMLGLRWDHLGFQDGVASRLFEEVVTPVRALARRTIDTDAVLRGAALPGTVGDRVAAQYAKHLYGKATLQDLPADGKGPRIVLNATNVQTGSLWRFAKPYMADWRVGRVTKPTTRLSVAVGASSAFPPLLSPVVLRLKASDYTGPPSKSELKDPSYRSHVTLTDGGVYDNLGLETAWKNHRTILISDGGAKMSPEPAPKRDLIRHSWRVLNLIDNQVRSLRKRQAVGAFRNSKDLHDGTYFGIHSDIANYTVAGTLDCPYTRTQLLAATATRLKALPKLRQERIINWGYAVCDAALRKHCRQVLAKHGVDVDQVPKFPYPRAAV